jgi:hypothetical protein
MAIVAGQCYLKINGNQYNLREGLNLSLDKEEGESIVGQDQYHGIMIKPKVCFIEGVITDTFELNIKEFSAFRDVTVTVELANGKTGMLRQANQIKALELETETGKIAFRFEGPDGEWLN